MHLTTLALCVLSLAPALAAPPMVPGIPDTYWAPRWRNKGAKGLTSDYNGYADSEFADGYRPPGFNVPTGYTPPEGDVPRYGRFLGYDKNPMLETGEGYSPSYGERYETPGYDGASPEYQQPSYDDAYTAPAQPSYETPTPVYEETPSYTAAGYEAPAQPSYDVPAYETPNTTSSYDTQPSYETPTPVYETPAYTAPPVYAQPAQPSYETPTPAYNPSYDTASYEAQPAQPSYEVEYPDHEAQPAQPTPHKDNSPLPPSHWHDKDEYDEAEEQAIRAKIMNRKATLLDILRGDGDGRSDMCVDSLWPIVEELHMDKRCQAAADDKQMRRDVLAALTGEDRKAYKKAAAERARAEKKAVKAERELAKAELDVILDKMYRKAAKLYKKKLRKANKPDTRKRTYKKACHKYKRCRGAVDSANAAAEAREQGKKAKHVHKMPAYCPQLKVQMMVDEGMPCQDVCLADLQAVLTLLMDDVFEEPLAEVAELMFESKGGDVSETDALRKFKELLREVSSEVLSEGLPEAQ